MNEFSIDGIKCMTLLLNRGSKGIKHFILHSNINHEYSNVGG